MRVAFDEIDDQNRRLEIDRVKQLQSFKQQVLGALQRLEKKQKLSTMTIEKHLTSLHDLTSSPINERVKQSEMEIRYKRRIEDADIENLSTKMNELATAMKDLSSEGKTIASEQRILRLNSDFGRIDTGFCLFVDGLDEYSVPEGGSYRELAQLLEEISDSPHVKLCVASRPENDFVDIFGVSEDRRLRVEDFTEHDIRLYVLDCFHGSRHFRNKQILDARYEHLVQQIVEEAKGVFLWVFFAVRSILQGVTNADKIEELEKRLSLVPKTLEGYFQHMLDSVDDEYKDSTPWQIQIALAADTPIELILWWFLDGETIDFAFRSSTNK
ncbi:MAG: hypothetical protein Q9165_005799 [Trypethelium subeluteriae]